MNDKNRLLKLLKRCRTFEQFLQEAIKQSSWFLRPHVQAGAVVNKPWLESFWKANKAGI